MTLSQSTRSKILHKSGYRTDLIGFYMWKLMCIPLSCYIFVHFILSLHFYQRNIKWPLCNDSRVSLGNYFTSWVRPRLGMKNSRTFYRLFCKSLNFHRFVARENDRTHIPITVKPPSSAITTLIIFPTGEDENRVRWGCIFKR